LSLAHPAVCNLKFVDSAEPFEGDTVK